MQGFHLAACSLAAALREPSFLFMKKSGISLLSSPRLPSTTGDLWGLVKSTCFAKGQPMICPALLPSHPPTAPPQKHLNATHLRGVEGRFCSRTTCPHVSAGFCVAFLNLAAPCLLSAGSWLPCWVWGLPLACSCSAFWSHRRKRAFHERQSKTKALQILKAGFLLEKTYQALGTFSCAGTRLSHCSENGIILGNTRNSQHSYLWHSCWPPALKK